MIFLRGPSASRRRLRIPEPLPLPALCVVVGVCPGRTSISYLIIDQSQRPDIEAGGLDRDNRHVRNAERVHFLQSCKKCRRVLDEHPAGAASTQLWGWVFGRTSHDDGA
jgi:hypothetical protein